MNQQAVFSLLVHLGRDDLAGKTVGIMHLDNVILNISTKEDAVLPVQVIDTSLRNTHKPESSTQILSTDTPRPSLMSFTLETCNNAKSSFEPLWAFLVPTFN